MWTDAADTAGTSAAWVLHQRMARSLTQVGLHAEADQERVWALGWSSRCLTHRARLLRGALQGRLADVWATARQAIGYATHLLGQRDRQTDADIVAATCAHLRRQLRWPAQLAALDGWERTSALADQQLLLAQVIGLEAKVAQACAEHLVYGRMLAAATCRHVTGTGAVRLAQRQVLEAARPWLRAHQLLAADAHQVGNPLPIVDGGPPAGLTERVIAASVATPPGPATGTSPRWS
ncbi:hypothetical protein ACWDRB_66575 [Nonomuraea sp. NPDC003707]